MEHRVRKDLTGKVFGKLTVLGIDHFDRRGAHYKCRCSCQNQTVIVVAGANLSSGNTTSCGCKITDTARENHFEDFTGRKIGRLIVIGFDHFERHRGSFWKCKCTCPKGTELVVSAFTLRHTKCPSCGCYHSDRMHELKFQDLTGQVFGRLTVLRRANDQNGKVMYECKCSCKEGTIVVVAAYNLKNGHTTSCGCYSRESSIERNTKYASDDERKIASVFHNMKQRCTDSNSLAFKDYGGRGITVCDEWIKDPVKFVSWAKENGWRPGLTIDRIDNNKGYSPDNCRFTDAIEQANNRRTNRRICVNGDTMTVSQWARKIGVNPKTMYFRSDEEIVQFILSKM